MHASGDRTLVLGVTDMGKSSWLKGRAADLLAQGVRIVAVPDVGEEWSLDGLQRPGVDLGPLARSISVHQLAEAIAAKKSPLREKRLSLAVRPKSRSAKDCARAADLVLHQVQLIKQPVLVLLEEVGHWAGLSVELASAATMGRKDGVALALISQRMNLVPATARSQCNHIVTFRQEERLDLDALAERTNDVAFARAAAALPPHQFLEWQRNPTTPSQGAVA